MRKVLPVVILLIFVIMLGSKYWLSNLQNEVVNLQGQFGLFNGKPVRIIDNTLYMYNADGTWKTVGLDKEVVRILSGENACILTADGKIFYSGLSEKNDEEMPLTTAYRMDMIDEILEINENSSFVDVNKNFDYIDIRALLENGDILYQTQGEYKCYTFPDENPVRLSGDFVLTKEGNVYYLCTDMSYVDLKMVYAGGDVVMISASETSTCCIGLKKDGSVESWSIQQPSLEVNAWRNIVSVCQGFNYAIALDSNGRVYFESQDAKQVNGISEVLNAWRNVVEIAAYFDVIVGMQEDGTCLFLNITDYGD